MQVIDATKIRKLAEARKTINDLQVRLMIREQALEDLARSCEIAVMTRQIHLIESFMHTALEQLEDKLVLPQEEDVDMKIRIYE
jgi:uncharacterized protein YqiB (DUF1249 family)